MRIWIDLAAPAHPWLFAPVAAALGQRGHAVTITARDHGETLAACDRLGLAVTRIGRHGGARLAAKATRLALRSAALVRFASGRRFELCLSHNSYALAVAARAARLRHVVLMDYEHQPANHLSFRLADRILVPAAFDRVAGARCGATPAKTRTYDGLKEEIYLVEQVTPAAGRSAWLSHFESQGPGLDLERDVLVLVRPPPAAALYHRHGAHPLFAALVPHLTRRGARVLVLPRDQQQRRQLQRARPPGAAVARQPVAGPSLTAASDLVVSAGGTMAREAAALGVPAASIFAGRLGGVDRQLIREGRLRRLETQADLEALPVERRRGPLRRIDPAVRERVIELLLGD